MAIQYLGELQYDIQNGASAEDVAKAYPEFNNNIELINELHYDISNGADVNEIEEAYPELSGGTSNNNMPDLVTKNQIKETKNRGDTVINNIAAGSVTGLIETGGLAIAGAKAFGEQQASLPLSSMGMLGDLFNRIKEIIPEKEKENFFGEYQPVINQFSSFMESPFSSSTKIKDDAQRMLGANPDSGWTTLGEFLTPDTYLGVSGLAKGGAKVGKELLTGALSSVDNFAERFIKGIGGVNRQSFEKHLELLKANPEQALKELNIEQADLPKIIKNFRDDILGQGLKDEADKLDDIAKQVGEAYKKETAIGEGVAGIKQINASAKLDEISNLAKTKIDEASEGLSFIGKKYDDYKGVESDLMSDKIGGIFKSRAKKKLGGTVYDNAVNIAMKEIDTITEKAPKNSKLTYDQLIAIRQNIDKKINWGDTASTSLNKDLKELRNKFDDEIIAKQFRDSKFTDAEYANSRQFLDEIRDTFGKGGIEGDSFRRKLTTLHSPTAKKEAERYAKLLDMSYEDFVDLSRKLSDDLKAKPIKSNIDVKGVENITSISNSTKRKLITNIEASGIENGEKIVGDIEKIAKENKYLNDYLVAKGYDSDLIAKGGKGGDENLIATIFEDLNKEVGRKGGEAANALQLLKNKIGVKDFKKLEIANAVNELKSKANESSVANILFNVGAVFAKLKNPAVGVVLEKYATKPEQAIEFVIQKAKRDASREAAKKIKEGGKLNINEVRAFLGGLGITKQMLPEDFDINN